MSRRRTLRPDEQELWHAVARSARPLHPGAPRPARPPETSPPLSAPEPARPAPAPEVPVFRLGEKARTGTAIDLVPGFAEALKAAPLRMDAKTHGRMTRGKLAPEARIDLHGLTLAEAHPELIRFILNAQSEGMRLVLVITGKGRKAGADHGPIPQRVGALRHQLPAWLRQAPLGPAVLQVAEAHIKHGGAGAFYVYLRRPGGPGR